MRKIPIALAILFLSVAFTLPSSRVKAAPMPDFVVKICGNQFYFESIDYPAYIIGYIVVYPSGGGSSQWIPLFGSNAEWVDVGYPIDHLDVGWGTIPMQLGTFSVTGSECGGSTALINMYVYYSATPFFGNTHTITIFSAAGFPSKGTLTAFAGGKLPEDFSYGAPACWGPLYDDGTDKGRFDCDGFLASVGERRAYLKNDPEGPAFDLLPKIENYFKMLDELGITPQLPNPTGFNQTTMD